MSKSYEEAVKCLREWYDRLRLVQKEHIRSIVDALPVKNGSDKEILHFPRNIGSLLSAVGPGSCGAVDTPQTAASRRGLRTMLAVVGLGVAILVPKTTHSEVQAGEQNAHQCRQDQGPSYLTVRTWSQQQQMSVGLW